MAARVGARVGAQAPRRAFLFDCDGTLVHTDHIHFHAWRDMLATLGVTLAEPDYVTIAGRQNPPVLREMFPDMPEEDIQAYSLEKENRFRELAKTEVIPVEGAIELLRELERHNMPKALVTNAPRANVDFMLEAGGLLPFFPRTHQILGDECARGKPHPDPYLAGLQLCQADAATSIAFEDSPAGAAAAIAAQIPTVGLLTTQTDDVMRDAGCFITARDFASGSLLEHLRSEGLLP